MDASSPLDRRTLVATIRDFRFYDAGDPTTDPDFENPPNTGASSYDDPDIVTDTLGADGDTINLYYGAADTFTALCFCDAAEIIKFIKEYPLKG